MNAANAKLATRLTGRPNHHLWNNHGTWYVHYTVHPTPLTKERVRKSLRTHNLTEARRRRDETLAAFAHHEGRGQ